MTSKKLPASIIILFFASAAAVLSVSAQHTPAAVDNERDEEVVTLPEYRVSASSQTDPYIMSEATGGTRAGAQILDLPFNVQVLTRQFIEDFKLFDTDQQLAFVPNYAPGNRDAGIITLNKLRGFQPMMLRDGFLRTAPANFTNTGQVEVVMGPQSTLYGQTSPGGVVNYVSKRPRTKAGYKLALVFGSYDFQRQDLEATGPLYKNKLYYMLSASHSYTRSDTDYYYRRSFVYNFTTMYKLSSSTTFTAYWEQQRMTLNKGDTMPGLLIGSAPASAAKPLHRTGGIVQSSYMPLAHFNAYGPDDHCNRNFEGANMLIEHRFSRFWSGRLSLTGYWKDFSEERMRGNVNYVPETGRLTSNQPFKQEQYEQGKSAQFDLLGRLYGRDTKHVLLFAADYTHQDYDDTQLAFANTTAGIDQLPDDFRFIDPYNPGWSSYNVDWSTVDKPIVRSVRDFDVHGLMASYRMYMFGERLITMVSGRYSEANAKVTNYVPANAPAADGSERYTTYSVGFNYKILGNNLVIFGNYSTSVDTSIAIVDAGTGKLQKPEQGKGPELGIKGGMFDQKLGYTLSFFEITKKNIANTNRDYVPGAGVPQYLAQGENRVRGFDLNVTAKPSKNFLIAGGFGYLDANVTKAPDLPHTVGDRTIQVPNITASGIVRYTIPHGSLKGLQVGVSTSYTGGMVISAGTNTRLREEHAPYQLCNVFASFGWRTGRFRHTVSANVLNLFDKEYLNTGNRLGRGFEVRAGYALVF